MMACCSTTVIKPTVYCPRPDRPTLSENMDDMGVMESLMEMAVYAIELEKTVDCFEKSTK